MIRLRILSLALLVSACSSATDDRPWNVLLITLDTTRADYFGIYGNPDGLTPSLDALGEDGTVFETALSTAAVTPVSHASILTGLNQYRHGLRVLDAKSGYRLPKDVPSLASVLADRGWSTAAVHSAFPVSGWFGFDHAFQRFESFDAKTIPMPGGHTGWDVRENQRRSDVTTDIAIDVVRNTAEPYFLWVHYWDPHDWGEDEHTHPPPRYLKDMTRGPRGNIRHKDLYSVELRYMDEQLGRLFDALKQSKQYDRTLIVVTADHGEGLGDHGWQSHRILYQEQIHVPLIVHVPGGPHGRRVGGVVSTVDIYPTVLDYLDIKSPDDVDGLSLRDLIEGGTPQPRYVYADQINGYDLNAKMLDKREHDYFLYCVTDGKWKIVYRPLHPEYSELYDLESDPGETTNLYDTEVEVRRRLLGELAKRNGWVTHPFEDSNDGASAAEREAAAKRLADLGYAGGEPIDAPSEDRWVWTCPVHEDVRLDERGECPKCSAPLILRVR